MTATETLPIIKAKRTANGLTVRTSINGRTAEQAFANADSVDPCIAHWRRWKTCD